MKINDFLTLFNGVVELEVELTTELDGLSEWDSMAIVIFIAEIEEAEGVTLEPESISAAKTVAQLFELVIK